MKHQLKKLGIVNLLLLLILLISFFAGGDFSGFLAQDQEKPKKASDEGPSQESPFRVPQHQYVGVQKCKICHKVKAMGGEQYKVWEKSKHAQAFKNLASEKSKKVAKEKGIEDPQKDTHCLKCHTIASGVDAQWIVDSVTQEEGVSCEACHGPGADYKEKKIMKDKKLAVEKGLVLPDETTCKACHNKESPFYKEFKYEEYKEKIKHWKDAKSTPESEQKK